MYYNIIIGVLYIYIITNLYLFIYNYQGNAATASALAISMNWKSRLLPSILVGNLGNFIGTFGGLWLSTMVFKPIYMKIAEFIIVK